MAHLKVLQLVIHLWDKFLKTTFKLQINRLTLDILVFRVIQLHNNQQSNLLNLTAMGACQLNSNRHSNKLPRIMELDNTSTSSLSRQPTQEA